MRDKAIMMSVLKEMSKQIDGRITVDRARDPVRYHHLELLEELGLIEWLGGEERVGSSMVKKPDHIYRKARIKMAGYDYIKIEDMTSLPPTFPPNRTV